MAKVKAVLLRPLDGREIGSTMHLDRADFNRLKANGAVKAAPVAKSEGASQRNKAEGRSPQTKSEGGSGGA